MKSTIFSLAMAVATANAHTIFYELAVNGQSQGQLNGVRAPTSNQFVSDVQSPNMACNTDLKQPVSGAVIDVNPGDEISTIWGHIIGGAQSNGDADNPIAASHKGPVQMYMAKVDDAATNDGSGLSWFKVASEGLDTSKNQWGVDTLIDGGGKWDFTMPDLAAGQYLLRGEVLALHSAGDVNGAQFYISCAALNVGGSGTCAPTDTVSFPGAYDASDPGIKISIYGNTGQPDNGGKPYTAPGPDVISCAGGSGAGPAPPPAATSATAPPAAPTPTPTPNPTTLTTVTRPVATGGAETDPEEDTCEA